MNSSPTSAYLGKGHIERDHRSKAQLAQMDVESSAPVNLGISFDFQRLAKVSFSAIGI
jgi:hypothetical protein